MSRKNAIREERIFMEAVVDANGPEEQAMGWYYYLDDEISFPFAAKCIAVCGNFVEKQGVGNSAFPDKTVGY
jgi:hypothetical protein